MLIFHHREQRWCRTGSVWIWIITWLCGRRPSTLLCTI